MQDVKGPQTVAFNLPNDERIVKDRGTYSFTNFRLFLEVEISMHLLINGFDRFNPLHDLPDPPILSPLPFLISEVLRTELQNYMIGSSLYLSL